MSWTYPARSRSRSPRSRPPYGEPMQDMYRGEYDTYDRDRGWGGYDRPGYDYGRRGRSRSPTLDETGRKRRRSMSPYDRDRFDPRPRYNDDYDAHSRGYGYPSPPRRGHPSAYPPARRPPPDPHTFDYPASLKQYAEWFRYFYPQQAIEEDNADKAAEQEAGDGSKPRNGIKSKWEAYKKDFSATQLQTMFDHHRKSPWFAEKYDPSPEMQSLRMRVRKGGWKGRLDTFLLDLESGKFDPVLSEPELEPSSPMKENVVNGESTIEANGQGEEKPSVVDDDMQFNVDGDEEPGDNDASRADASGKNIADKRSNRGEEVSVPPEGNQVMIRTIPPDIGRLKLEEACGKIPGFVYLALGDPLQKRNYYRAGWLRFRDDADMPAVLSELSEKKIEGFKLHVSHNTRPFTNRVRYAPEVASKPDRIRKDLASAKALTAVLEQQAATLRQFNSSSVVKGDSEANKPDGDEDLNMAAPEAEDAEEEPDPKENGSDAIERRIEKLMTDMRDLGLVDEKDEKVYEDKKAVISLDLYIAYLRAAFHTCYYCAVVTDHLEELQRKCLKHARKPLSKAMLEEIKVEAEKAEKDKEKAEKKADEMMEGVDAEKEKEKEKDAKKDRQGDRDWKRNDDRWLEWLDSKLALLINRDAVDLRAYSAKSYEEELTKAVEPYIKQEDEGKFRCKTCQKLFKATSFVEKHIANKHPELVKHLDDIPYFNNFALDPHHIQPFTHPPQITGNSSQVPPPQAYGLQAPPAYHGSDYGPYYGSGAPYSSNYPPSYHSNNYWEPHPYGSGPAAPYGPPGGYPRPPPSRRDDAVTARRLSERLGGYAPGTGLESVPLPPGAGLPPKPTAAALDSALVSGNAGGDRGGVRRGRNGSGQNGPPPPPPPDAKEDPRAAAGKRVSYHDMDLVAEVSVVHLFLV
ncbi:hypothetical protein H2248_005767 [Termitomyces sp. 'cryptogamus']|nr:hypothetical protein H2248_005767 [Termitomyces sp. 'cryptogamus']